MLLDSSLRGEPPPMTIGSEGSLFPPPMTIASLSLAGTVRLVPAVLITSPLRRVYLVPLPVPVATLGLETRVMTREAPGLVELTLLV